MGLAGMACGAMAGGNLSAADELTNPLAPKNPHFDPKAKAVIYLHMAGSPTQLDLFDYKPELKRFDGQDCPPEFLEGRRAGHLFAVDH